MVQLGWGGGGWCRDRHYVTGGESAAEKRVYEVKGQHWVAGSNSGGCGLQDGLPRKTV